MATGFDAGLCVPQTPQGSEAARLHRFGQELHERGRIVPGSWAGLFGAPLHCAALENSPKMSPSVPSASQPVHTRTAGPKGAGGCVTPCTSLGRSAADRLHAHFTLSVCFVPRGFTRSKSYDGILAPHLNHCNVLTGKAMNRVLFAVSSVCIPALLEQPGTCLPSHSNTPTLAKAFSFWKRRAI